MGNNNIDQKSKSISSIIGGAALVSLKPILSAMNEVGVKNGIESALELAKAMNSTVATVLFIVIALGGIALAGWGVIQLIKDYN